jgi:hypothetical protein
MTHLKALSYKSDSSSNTVIFYCDSCINSNAKNCNLDDGERTQANDEDKRTADDESSSNDFMKWLKTNSKKKSNEIKSVSIHDDRPDDKVEGIENNNEPIQSKLKNLTLYDAPSIRVVAYESQSRQKMTLTISPDTVLEIVGGPYSTYLNPQYRKELATMLCDSLFLSRNRGMILSINFANDRKRTTYCRLVWLLPIRYHNTGLHRTDCVH